MLTDYERYQLEWMIEHRHSLDELMAELTYYQNDLEATKGVNLTVSDVFDAWTSDRGFASLENDVITKDMIRAGIEHGVMPRAPHCATSTSRGAWPWPPQTSRCPRRTNHQRP